MHAMAVCICLLTGPGEVHRPPVEAPTPVLVPARTLDNRTIGFFTGWNAIFHCVTVGDDETLKRLLKEGHDLNPPFNNRGGTVLHHAIHLGNPKVVELLLEHGADPNATIGDRPTPLELAKNRAEGAPFDQTRKIIVSLLQEYGAN